MITEDSVTSIFDRVATAVAGNFTGVKISSQGLHIIEETKAALESEYGFRIDFLLVSTPWANHNQIRRILERDS